MATPSAPPPPDLLATIHHYWQLVVAACAFCVSHVTLRAGYRDLLRRQEALEAQVAAERKAGEESRRRVWTKLDQMGAELRASDDALRDDLREDMRELRALMQAALAARPAD